MQIWWTSRISLFTVPAASGMNSWGWTFAAEQPSAETQRKQAASGCPICLGKGLKQSAQAALETNPCSTAAGCPAGNLPGQVLTLHGATWAQLNTTLLQVSSSNYKNDNSNNIETCLPKSCLWTPMGIAREYIKLLVWTWIHSLRVNCCFSFISDTVDFGNECPTLYSLLLH